MFLLQNLNNLISFPLHVVVTQFFVNNFMLNICLLCQYLFGPKDINVNIIFDFNKINFLIAVGTPPKEYSIKFRFFLVLYKVII